MLCLYGLAVSYYDLTVSWFHMTAEYLPIHFGKTLGPETMVFIFMVYYGVSHRVCVCVCVCVHMCVYYGVSFGCE